MTYSEVKLWNELKNAQLNGYDFDRQRAIANYIVETHPCPSKEGMHPHSASLFEGTLYSSKLQLWKQKKLIVVVSYPLLGGAKLTNGFTVNDLGGFVEWKNGP